MTKQEQQPPAAPANVVPIAYIGQKDKKKDNVAGTGLVWARGQIHYLPPLIAQQLAQHPSVWKEAWDEAEADPTRVGLVVDTTDTTLTPTTLEKTVKPPLNLPNLQGMTKPDLVAFASSQFNTQLDSAMKKDEMVQQIVALSNSAAADGAEGEGA